MPVDLTNHPKQKLLFFISDDMDQAIRSNVRDFVLRLASLKQWLNGPPQFVNSREEPQGIVSGDLPIETVGGYLEIYSALPPWVVPREIDLQHLDEVTALVEGLRNFSREHGLTFEMELDDVFVGSIQNGEMDESLSEGLLGEWRRQLGVA
jgi:hypothetical protein